MKKILIILDGLADSTYKPLKNKTPLEYAKTPNLDFLAKNSLTGLLQPIKGIAPESGSSQFAILGQNLKYYPGRGPIEALGLNYKIKKNETALRCNFAKFKNNKLTNIREKIPKNIIKKLNKINKDIKIIPSINYRAVMIVKNTSPNIQNTHPGYIKYKNISKAVTPSLIKKNSNNKKINSFIEKAEKIMKNKTILIRGAGNALPKIKKLKNWSLIADMPIEIGLGKLLGMKILKRQKNEIKQIINSKTNIYIQIKGPDHFGHLGNLKEKIKSIEKIDKALKPLTKLKNTLLCITSDHATPCKLKRHSKDPVPLLIYGKEKDNVNKFSEKSCKNGKLGLIQGKELLKFLK